MGLKTIRVIAFLDIIIAAGFIAQQISYTADQYNVDPNGPKANVTEEIPQKQVVEPQKPLCGSDVVFPFGQVIRRKSSGSSPPHKEYIPKERLWIILILVVSTSFFSILSSIAVIHTTKLRYNPSSEKFTCWIKCYAVSLLATIIVAGVGYSVPSVILSCIIFISLRASLAVVLSEEFVCMALTATTLRGYKNDAFKQQQAKNKSGKMEQITEKQHNPSTFLVMEFPSIKDQSNSLCV